MLKEINLISDAFQLVANRDEQDCFHKLTNLCKLEKHHYVCQTYPSKKKVGIFVREKKKAEMSTKQLHLSDHA